MNDTVNKVDITKLKAEAFDLMVQRDQVIKQVNDRLTTIYAEINKAHNLG